MDSIPSDEEKKYGFFAVVYFEEEEEEVGLAHNTNTVPELHLERRYVLPRCNDSECILYSKHIILCKKMKTPTFS